MSISSIGVIDERVRNSESGIAIFNGRRRGGKRGSLDAVFADTFETVKAIKRRDINYICTLNRKMSDLEILSKLDAASTSATGVIDFVSYQ